MCRGLAKRARAWAWRAGPWRACGGALVVAGLVVNFDSRWGDWGSDRVIKSTPDQMYEPTYPVAGPAASFGVIYAANGPFLPRALESAMALGEGANATIFSDANGTRVCERLTRRLGRARADGLAGIRCVAAPPAMVSWGFRAAKLWAFTAAPYDKTLYVDADAYPCAGFDWLRHELGPALERYDILAAHSSFRKGFPHALHWLNAGVIAFNSRSSRARGVFETWLATYRQAAEATAVATDQRLFNEAVLHSAARPMALPPEWNCKSNYKSVRFEWAKHLSPALYRKVRKNWRCCGVASIGDCVIDHECHFPNARDLSFAAQEVLARRQRRRGGGMRR